jgi:hypothetical protein
MKSLCRGECIGHTGPSGCTNAPILDIIRISPNIIQFPYYEVHSCRTGLQSPLQNGMLLESLSSNNQV